jgi:hypothetical protein
MIEFIGPLYNWLQQYTNHYLTHCHLLPTGHSTGTILTSNWTPLYSFKSKSHCDWRSVSQYVLVSNPIWGLWPDIYYCLTVTVLFLGAPSLTRGRVCGLQLLLLLASAVFVRSESIGTHDHILLSQIWDFPFRCLLRLAGSRLRCSTPPPLGLRLYSFKSSVHLYNFSARTPWKTPFSVIKNAYLLSLYLAVDVLLLRA